MSCDFWDSVICAELLCLSLLAVSQSVMSRTPRNFYSARRDIARRCLNTGSTFSGFRLSEEAEALLYQPHKSLFDNPS